MKFTPIYLYNSPEKAQAEKSSTLFRQAWAGPLLSRQKFRHPFSDVCRVSLPYPPFLTALRTGLRLGEHVALQPGNLDFNGWSIEVRRSYAKGHLTTTKSGKIRRVDMSEELAETVSIRYECVLDLKRMIQDTALL